MAGQKEQLFELCQETFGDNEINCVEIGTQTAGLTTAILRNLRVRRLWTIDPWEYREGAGYEAGRGPQAGHDKAFEVAVGKLCNLSVDARDRVAILYMHSDEAVDWIPWQTIPIDFVWIDGDHTEYQVKKDVHSYRKMVRPGGFIGGHDFGTRGPVKAAVEDIFHSDVINLGINTCWWVFL